VTCSMVKTARTVLPDLAVLECMIANLRRQLDCLARPVPQGSFSGLYSVRLEARFSADPIYPLSPACVEGWTGLWFICRNEICTQRLLSWPGLHTQKSMNR